jgi:hypothetical protein
MRSTLHDVGAYLDRIVEHVIPAPEANAKGALAVDLSAAAICALVAVGFPGRI